MGRRKRGADGYEAVCALGVTLHYVPLTRTFLAFLHLTLFSREFSLSQNLKNEKQPTSTGSVSMGSNHTRKGCFILKRGMFHTGLTVLAFYEFWGRENSLEKKVRCGKAKKGSGRV